MAERTGLLTDWGVRRFAVHFFLSNHFAMRVGRIDRSLVVLRFLCRNCDRARRAVARAVHGNNANSVNAGAVLEGTLRPQLESEVTGNDPVWLGIGRLRGAGLVALDRND